MKKILLAVVAALTFASVSQAYDWAYDTAANAWTSNSYQSTDLQYKDVWRFFEDGTSGNSDETWPGDYTNGVGQIFNVTNTFTVEKVRIWSGRYYNTNDMTVSIYKNLDLTAGVPADYMVPSNLVAQYTIDPGTNAPAPGGTSFDVLQVSLATNEYFDLSPLATNQHYYLHVDFEAADVGTNTWNWLFHWSYSEDYDPNGYFVTPEGTGINAGRDLGIAFLSTNPPVVIVDPVPTNWFFTVADTYLREGHNTTGNYGTSGSLDMRNTLDGSTVIRDYFAYIRFDLTELAGAVITNASLNLERSWYNSGGTTIEQIRVLGLDNIAGNTPQDWSETGLTSASLGSEYVSSNSAPGLLPTFDMSNRVTNIDSSFTNTAESVFVDTNGVTRYTISGPAFVDWLNERLQDADTNGVIYATVILDSVNGGNYYWGFASKEASVGYAPYLELDWVGGAPPGPGFDPTINSISIAGGTATIVWESDTVGTYRIENKTALDDPSWNPVPGATNLPAAGAAGVSTPVPVSGDAEFFRVYGE